MTNSNTNNNSTSLGLGSLGIYLVLGAALIVTEDSLWAYIALGIFGFQMLFVVLAIVGIIGIAALADKKPKGRF